MRIVVIGSGYVGLVTGLCFAEFGFDVTSVDKDPEKIDRLNEGHIPIYEQGLESLMAQALKKNKIRFMSDIKNAIEVADVVMITVGTPALRGDGYADLTYVYEAAKEVAHSIKNYTVIVTKSTVPVGTCQEVASLIKGERPELQEGKDFDVVSNPEFLREGSAVNDFMRPDRIIIGTLSDKAREVMRKLYRPLYLIETPIVFTDRETAELIKYASNGFLALKIAFINQMADLCERTGANVQELAKGMGLDKRINQKFLNVSPGFGGSCFPKDTLALSHTANRFGVPLTLIDAVIDANSCRKKNILSRILKKLNERNLARPRVAVLGITFKPNTDDLREAPSLVIVSGLLEAGIEVCIYDPLYYKGSERLTFLTTHGIDWREARWAISVQEAIDQADAVVILTEWNEFRGLDLEDVKKRLRKHAGFKPLMLDFRNIYKLDEVEGLHYVSLGRPEKA